MKMEQKSKMGRLLSFADNITFQDGCIEFMMSEGKYFKVYFMQYQKIYTYLSQKQMQIANKVAFLLAKLIVHHKQEQSCIFIDKLPKNSNRFYQIIKEVIQNALTINKCTVYSFINKYKLMKKVQDRYDQKIIGSDDLQRVTREQLKTLFHRSIGAFTFNRSSTMYVGSGIMISANLFLTAAHNICDRVNQSQYDNFKLYLQADGQAQKHLQIESYRYLPEYMTCPFNKIKCDYALVKLKHPIGFKQFVPLTIPCQFCLMQRNKTTKLSIFGYPGGGYRDNYVRTTGRKFTLNQYGLSKIGKIVSADPVQCQIKYSLSTRGGESGTAIYMNQSIIGLHCAGGNENDDFNVGRLITNDLIQNLKKWCDELNGIPFAHTQTNVCSHKKYADLMAMIQLFQSQLKYSEEDRQRLIKKCQKEQLKNKELRMQLQAKDKKINEQQIQINQAEQINKEVIKMLQIEQQKNNQPKQPPQIQKGQDMVQKQYIQPQIKKILQETIMKDALELSQKGLSAIDVSKHINIKYLGLKKNKLTTINLQNNLNLYELWLEYNELEVVDISKNKKLTKVILSYNKLYAIYLKENVDLVDLSISNNFLPMIDLSNNKKLAALSIWNNQLTGIDFSNNPKMAYAQLRNNCLMYVIIWYSPGLKLLLANQRSSKCLLTLLYRKKGEAQACKKWGEQAVNTLNYSQENVNKCNFILRIEERA